MSDAAYEFPPPDEHRTTKPQKKWRLIGLVSVALILGGWGIAVLEQRREKAWLQEAFRLDVDVQNRVIVATSIVPDVTEKHLHSLAEYPRLQKLVLTGTNSGDLSTLPEFQDLRVLELSDCAWVDDEQAALLDGLNDLKVLDLSGTRISEEGLRTVSQLPRLTVLHIQGCEGVGDAGLETCAEMSQLEELWPAGCGYTVDGLFALRERRRDLSLQLKPSDVRDHDASLPEPTISVSFEWEDPRVQSTIQTRVQSATADVNALAHLLRFPQNWSYGEHGRRCQGGYVKDIEKTWDILELHGPGVSDALPPIFNLTPELSMLQLHRTTLIGDEFPFDQLPSGLSRFHIDDAEVDETFWKQLSQHTNLTQLSLRSVALKGMDRSDPAIGRFDGLDSLTLHHVTVDGVDLTDPILQPVVLRLKQLLLQPKVVVYSESFDRLIRWGQSQERWYFDPRVVEPAPSPFAE